MTLPDYTSLPASDYGFLAAEVLVVHVSQNNSGLSVANYCVSNPSSYRWHWTIGQDGQAWKHLEFGRRGAHDAGINDISVGIEHAGFCEPSTQPLTVFKNNPAQLTSSAMVCAEFAKAIGKVPSRDWIIGHSEDSKYGGTSTHQDPGSKWPWDDYMKLVTQFYEEDDMALTGNEYNALAFLYGQQRRAKGNPVPTKYVAGDGADRLDAAVAGWSDKDAEIAARP